MPVNTLMVGSKPCCQHQQVQTTGDTTSAGGADTLASWRSLTNVSERFLCFSLLRGDGRRCLILRCPKGFCRTRAGTLSLLHRWSRGREPFTSAQEERAAVELHLLALTRWVNPQGLCLQLGALGCSDSSRSKHPQSRTLPHCPFHAHVVPPDPKLLPPAQPPCARVAAGDTGF